jgi:hypothetical protein
MNPGEDLIVTLYISSRVTAWDTSLMLEVSGRVIGMHGPSRHNYRLRQFLFGTHRTIGTVLFLSGAALMIFTPRGTASGITDILQTVPGLLMMLAGLGIHDLNSLVFRLRMGVFAFRNRQNLDGVW